MVSHIIHKPGAKNETATIIANADTNADPLKNIHIVGTEKKKKNA